MPIKYFKAWLENAIVRNLLFFMAPILLLLFTALVTPLVIPTQYLNNLVSDWLVKILKQPVVIQETSLFLIPKPELYVGSMQLNAHGRTLVKANAIRLPIDPLGWFFGDEFLPFSVQQAVFEPVALIAALSNTDKPLQIPSFRVQQTFLGSKYPDMIDKPVAMTVAMLPNGTHRVILSRDDDTVAVDITRAGKALLLNIKSQKWHFYSNNSLIVTKLSGIGRVIDERLEIDRIAMQIGDGKIQGVIRLEKIKDWNISGSLTLGQTPLLPLLTWMGMPLLDGKANGTLYLSGESSDIMQLPDIASLSGYLSIGSGKIMGIDLIKPAQQRLLGDSVGGDTPFDLLKLAVEGNGIGEWSATISTLQLPNMSGKGFVRISEGFLLDGVVDMQLKTPDNLPVIPLLIAGTINNTKVRLPIEVFSTIEAMAVKSQKSSAVGASLADKAELTHTTQEDITPKVFAPVSVVLPATILPKPVLSTKILPTPILPKPILPTPILPTPILPTAIQAEPTPVYIRMFHNPPHTLTDTANRNRAPVATFTANSNANTTDNTNYDSSSNTRAYNRSYNTNTVNTVNTAPTNHYINKPSQTPKNKDNSDKSSINNTRPWILDYQ